MPYPGPPVTGGPVLDPVLVRTNHTPGEPGWGVAADRRRPHRRGGWHIRAGVNKGKGLEGMGKGRGGPSGRPRTGPPPGTGLGLLPGAGGHGGRRLRCWPGPGSLVEGAGRSPATATGRPCPDAGQTLLTLAQCCCARWGRGTAGRAAPLWCRRRPGSSIRARWWKRRAGAGPTRPTPVSTSFRNAAGAQRLRGRQGSRESVYRRGTGL